MPKITDPTDLVRNESVIWDVTVSTARKIGLSSSADVGASNIAPLESGSDSGVTGQALYSFAKEQWKSETDLIRIPFPFTSITKTQFDLVNNWNYVDDATRYLVRDAGWAVISGSNNVTTEEWVGIVTLGTLGSTDQVYFQQSGSTQAGKVGETLVNVVQNFKMSGSVNQAVMQYSASFADTERNFRTVMNVFVREYQKTFGNASIQSTLSVPLQEYTVYSLPLTNATDTNISTTVESEATGSPYTDLTITFLSGSGFTTWGTGQSYTAGESVVQSATTGRWYIAGQSYTGPSSGTDADLTGSSDGGGAWDPFTGERQIAGSWYAFNKIVNFGVGQNLSISQGYTRLQYELRLNSDIDDGSQFPADTYIGLTTDVLTTFVGATLVTANGVYIDNFQDADTNSIDFYDVAGVVHRFPYVATGIIAFNTYLSGDTDAEFFMFFTSVPSGSFGTTDAVVVNDNDGLPITGSVGGSGSYSFTFDYDNNAQGGRTSGSNAAVTVVAIGLSTAQYVLATGTIERSKANSISLVSALERNYSNP